VIPNDALALREALVNYIEENQHVEGDVEGVTLAQEIQLEYFPVRQSDGENDEEDVEQPPRRGLFNHTVDSNNYLIVNNMNEYLDLMQMPNTCIDEFVLSAFARMWSVRVAVLRTHGKGLSTDHSQFVYDQLEAQRTIFLLRHGHHFEWAHATSDSCDDPSCKRTNKRVSASHTPFGLPQVAAAAGSVVPDSLPQTSAPAAAPAGARLSNGGEEILQVLVGQLLEEYPGLDPERAEAALKLTKQGGKYSVYRASAKLPGVEGAPIVLRSPSPAQDTEDNEGASVRFTSGGERSSSSSSDDEDSRCHHSAMQKRQQRPDDEDEDGGAAQCKQAAPSEYSSYQQRSSNKGGERGDQRYDGGCGSEHLVKETRKCDTMQRQRGAQASTFDWAAYHMQRCRELHQQDLRNWERTAKAASETTEHGYCGAEASGCHGCGNTHGTAHAVLAAPACSIKHSQQQPASGSSFSAQACGEEKEQAIRMAAQIISIAAKRTVEEAYEMLLKHIIMHGDLQVAAARACQEFLNGAPVAQRINAVNNVPDNDGVSLAVRQLGPSARTVGPSTLAKHARLDAETSLPRPQRLFDDAKPAQHRKQFVSLSTPVNGRSPRRQAAVRACAGREIP
jgi:hypothetical protein